MSQNVLGTLHVVTDSMNIFVINKCVFNLPFLKPQELTHDFQESYQLLESMGLFFFF